MDVDSETRYHQVLTAVYLMGEQRLEAVTKDTIATIQDEVDVKLNEVLELQSKASSLAEAQDQRDIRSLLAAYKKKILPLCEELNTTLNQDWKNVLDTIQVLRDNQNALALGVKEREIDASGFDPEREDPSVAVQQGLRRVGKAIKELLNGSTGSWLWKGAIVRRDYAALKSALEDANSTLRQGVELLGRIREIALQYASLVLHPSTE